MFARAHTHVRASSYSLSRTHTNHLAVGDVVPCLPIAHPLLKGRPAGDTPTPSGVAHASLSIRTIAIIATPTAAAKASTPSAAIHPCPHIFIHHRRHRSYMSWREECWAGDSAGWVSWDWVGGSLGGLKGGRLGRREGGPVDGGGEVTMALEPLFGSCSPFRARVDRRCHDARPQVREPHCTHHLTPPGSSGRASQF